MGSLMTTAILGSVTVLTWSMMLLFLVQMLFALVLNAILFESYFTDESQPEEERRFVYQYFGSFTRALLSMFELTLANWPPVTRMLTEKVSEGFMFFCLFHKLTIGFAVVV